MTESSTERPKSSTSTPKTTSTISKTSTTSKSSETKGKGLIINKRSEKHAYKWPHLCKNRKYFSELGYCYSLKGHFKIVQFEKWSLRKWNTSELGHPGNLQDNSWNLIYVSKKFKPIGSLSKWFISEVTYFRSDSFLQWKF